MSDARHVRELEARCRLLEQAVLIQEKRVWSQDMLEKLERRAFLGEGSDDARERTRQLLRGNLRVAKEVLDRIALELGYERPSVFHLLDPEFVYGAPGSEVGEQLTQQLQLVDARERELGTSHLNEMLRELKTRHDDFLGEVQEQVQRDVDLHAIFSGLAID